MSKEKEYMKEEIRKEFQLERMVLFSDAVFAIVITLMAIEIHLPELHSFSSSDELGHELIKLIPTVIAYTVSFMFIGMTWYQHLQVFSLLKDYDKGLVMRNLLMLFFIGLFPFSASLMASPGAAVFSKVLIYFSIIVLSKGAQLMLQHYILVQRPKLRINTNIHEQLVSYKKTRIAISLLVVLFILISFATYLITDPEKKIYVWLLFTPFPFLLRFFQKRIK